MSDFTLSVRGVKYGGWTTLSISRGLDQLAHSYSVGLTDKWSDQAERVPVVSGDSVNVLFGNRVITTGFVDDDSINYDAASRTLSFSGRSKTGDLVDCAAKRANRKRSWRSTGLLKIAKDVCDPFGITVSTTTDLGRKFGKYTIEEGETAFALLQRAARMRGVLMTTDPDGNLVFERAGTTKIKTILKFGENILRCASRRSMRDRFSEYEVKCQTTGGDALSAKEVTIRRSAVDDGVNRYRPTVIMADNEDSGRELQKRADWERNVRAGQSRTFDYTVRGWTHEDGLWDPNTLVRVVDPQVWLDAVLLISQVTFSRSGSGTTTSLSLKAKEAYDVQPLAPAKKTQDNVLGGFGV